MNPPRIHPGQILNYRGFHILMTVMHLSECGKEK
jgi:hypothetical protein